MKTESIVLAVIITISAGLLFLMSVGELVNASLSSYYYQTPIPSVYKYSNWGGILSTAPYERRYFISKEESLEIMDRHFAKDHNGVYYQGKLHDYLDPKSFKIEDGRFFDVAGEYRTTRGGLKLKD